MILLLAARAWACATCFDPKDTNQQSFLGPTIFMSLLPLAMFAGVFGWVWWRVRGRTGPDRPSRDVGSAR